MFDDLKSRDYYYVNMRKGFVPQSGLSVIGLMIIVAIALVFAGGLFYSYFYPKIRAGSSLIPKAGQEILEKTTSKGGGRDMNIPIYPGSRKIEEVDMGPDGKASTYMVKAEPKDVIYFYVDELKKLGLDTSREAVDQQLLYTSMADEPQVIIGDEKRFVQVAGKKDKNGEVGYAIMIMASAAD